MDRVLLCLMLLSCWCERACSEEPVYFADPNLKAAVEAELWLLDPTPTDMLALTELICPNGYRRINAIVDLTGLEYAVNLQKLNLRYHLISDVRPLSGLTNLQSLVLNNNRISDLAALSDLNNLYYLDLHDNRISDIAAVSALHNLETLVLRTNQISDISVLAGLTILRELDLDHNQISDISPLSGLTSLTYLDIRANPLNDEACDVYIPQILANNPGISFKHDPCVFCQLCISSTAGGSVIDPGEGEFAFGQGQFVRLEARADPGFVFLGFSGSYAATDNPTFIPMNQDHEIQAVFAPALDVVYVDDDAPNDPGPGDGAISDSAEDGTSSRPFDQIQEAIAIAADRALIIVRPGTYHETITVRGKSVQLTGIDPDDPNGAVYPVIDGRGMGPVVSFVGSNTSSSTLTGFVITAGKGDVAAALSCQGSSPTVHHCLMVGNRATAPDGAAVYCAESQAVFFNCTIADNDGGQSGAGLRSVDSSVVVVDSILWGNGPKEIVVSGTGDPSITYSCVAGWWPDFGNIDEDPLFVQHGYWADPGDPNVAVAPGVPNAMWMGGDYHLQSQAGRWDPTARSWVRDETTSPCIDGGQPTSPVGQEPAPNGGLVNMGAYGGTPEASKSPSVLHVKGKRCIFLLTNLYK